MHLIRIPKDTPYSRLPEVVRQAVKHHPLREDFAFQAGVLTLLLRGVAHNDYLSGDTSAHAKQFVSRLIAELDRWSQHHEPHSCMAHNERAFAFNALMRYLGACTSAYAEHRRAIVFGRKPS